MAKKVTSKKKISKKKTTAKKMSETFEIPEILTQGGRNEVMRRLEPIQLAPVPINR